MSDMYFNDRGSASRPDNVIDLAQYRRSLSGRTEAPDAYETAAEPGESRNRRLEERQYWRTMVLEGISTAAVLAVTVLITIQFLG